MTKKSPMYNGESISRVRRECKYNVVFIPKYCHKVFYEKAKNRIGPILRDLCCQKGLELVVRKAVADRIHMCVSVPPPIQYRDGDRIPEREECDPDSPRESL
jgi:putative transposase